MMWKTKILIEFVGHGVKMIIQPLNKILPIRDIVLHFFIVGVILLRHVIPYSIFFR